MDSNKHQISDRQDRWLQFCDAFGINKGKFRSGDSDTFIVVAWPADEKGDSKAEVTISLHKGCMPLGVNGVGYLWDREGANAVKKLLSANGILSCGTPPIVKEEPSATAVRHPVKARYDLLSHAFLDGVFGVPATHREKDNAFLPKFLRGQFYYLDQLLIQSSLVDREAHLISAARSIFQKWRSASGDIANAEYLFIDKLAMIADVGAKKYGDRNWQKSQLVGDAGAVNHAIKHCFEYLKAEPNEYEPDGDHRTHLVQAAFNLMMEHFWLMKPEKEA